MVGFDSDSDSDPDSDDIGDQRIAPVSCMSNSQLSVLVKDDSDLFSIRRDHASMPTRERRMAADWEYHSQMASEIFENTMALFMTLVTLPEDEEDLGIIIDKAGDFLIDQNDYENALALYFAAERAYPHESIYPNGSGYCLGKLGRCEESVEKYRHADALDPDNYKHLNDLGHSLFEVGEFDEAEEFLQKSISIAPSG